MAKNKKGKKNKAKALKVHNNKPAKKKRKQSQSFLKKVEDFYFTEYKRLLFVPLVLLIIAVLSIGVKIADTGEFVDKGISLSGGISITISTSDLSPDTLEEDIIGEFGQIDLSIRTITSQGEQRAIILETAELEESQLTDFLKKQHGFIQDDLAIETTGSALGERFFQDTIRAIIIALVFMGAIVFIYFRSFVPSVAIILAAVSDLIMTLAVFNLLGLKLTSAGIAAFLMLIGYSVDTDILLSTRVLKRKEGTVNERIISALQTGLMMNITTLSAVTIALIFSQSQVLTQIMTILLIGLLFDMVNTWLQNVGILKWYLEKGGRK